MRWAVRVVLDHLLTWGDHGVPNVIPRGTEADSSMGESMHNRQRLNEWAALEIPALLGVVAVEQSVVDVAEVVERPIKGNVTGVWFFAHGFGFR